MKISIAILPLLATLALVGCDPADDGPVTPPGRLTHVLVDDWSFETNGKPYTFGWGISDTAHSGVVTGAPEGGGTYALKLEAVWSPPEFAETRILASPGKHRYDLSFYARTEGAAQGGGAQLIVQGNGTTVNGKLIPVKDTVWTRYTLTDTLTAASGDTLTLRLFAPPTELATGRTYYDLIRLDVEQ